MNLKGDCKNKDKIINMKSLKIDNDDIPEFVTKIIKLLGENAAYFVLESVHHALEKNIIAPMLTKEYTGVDKYGDKKYDEIELGDNPNNYLFFESLNLDFMSNISITNEKTEEGFYFQFTLTGGE